MAYLFLLEFNELIAFFPVFPAAPDGLAPPTLTSPTSTSVRATWMTVGRNNANEEPVFQLQFQETTPGSLVQEYVNDCKQRLKF